MELGFFAGLWSGAGELRLPTGAGRDAFLDLEDLAEVAAEALTRDGHAGRTYVLCPGPARAGQGRPPGGGVTTIRQFLDAGLVDTVHVAVSPVKLGSGLRLWESPDELLDRFHLEVVPSPCGVTHHLFWRR
ncbi:hypothetical protein STENM223S_03137 [Streptomyces tendae]